LFLAENSDRIVDVFEAFQDVLIELEGVSNNIVESRLWGGRPRFAPTAHGMFAAAISAIGDRLKVLLRGDEVDGCLRILGDSFPNVEQVTERLGDIYFRTEDVRTQPAEVEQLMARVYRERIIIQHTFGTEEEQKETFRTTELAQRLGVALPTLRKWMIAVGLPVPSGRGFKITYSRKQIIGMLTKLSNGPVGDVKISRQEHADNIGSMLDEYKIKSESNWD